MSNRREFLQLAGLAGTSLLTGCATGSNAAADKPRQVPEKPRQVPEKPRQVPESPASKFNMSGYAAPPIKTVRIGFIGLGNRGPEAVHRMARIEGVAINGLCDLIPERALETRQKIAHTSHNPTLYSGNENAWKKLCEREDIDLIYIATPWHLHVPMAVFAMEAGKHVAVEVPAAKTLEECWQLVETSEKTRKHCMILENCCYDYFELLTLNMARQGFFGPIVHVEGAYIHSLLDGLVDKSKYQGMWRLKENQRNGNLYPTHGLGPVAQILNINRGEKLDYMVSMSSNDFSLGPRVKGFAAKDAFYQEFADKYYRGNMNTSIIRTNSGQTLMIQHDTTSRRPYSRLHTVTGTVGVAQKYPLPARIANRHDRWMSEAEVTALEEKYRHPLVRKLSVLAKEVDRVHGGMDFLMDWRLIDCLRNGLPLDIDVYDAATWSSIMPLSQMSLANRSNSVDVPDFTRGSWKTNKPVDIKLKHISTP